MAGHGPAIAAGPMSSLSQATPSLPQMGSQAAVTKAGKRPLLLGAASFRLVFERFMLASGIDLLFVAISIFVVTFGSTLVNYARAERDTPLTELMPLDWLLAQEAARLLAGFFAVYLVYVVAFLVCAGGTLGSIVARTPFKARK